jgi:C4-dicarboxylate transporter, DctM subunit
MLLVSFLLLLLLIGLSIPVAGALGVLSLILSYLYSPMPLHLALADIVWSSSIEFILVAIPLFIFMGEILLRSGLASKMYEALSHWIGWLPGGLMHSNIGSCAMFAATSGSSVATAATISTVAIPEIKKRGYNERLFLGSLTSGGTLGILIPPSINIIIYGLLTDTSVPQLYLAGLLPGVMMALLFGATVLLACSVKPSWGGERIHSSWKKRFVCLKDLIPPLIVFFVVVGSIYAGVATPTEAASLGVVMSMILAFCTKTLSVNMIKLAAEGTMRSTAMVMLIILAAIFLNFVLGTIGLTQSLALFVSKLGLTPIQMMFAIVVFYLILGCFMETLSMLITTAPLITPIIISIGYDPVWFGILLMVLLEMALLTPPIGINLYVVQGVRRTGNINDVIIGTIPFLFTMLLMVMFLIFWPEIATWLPLQFK